MGVPKMNTSQIGLVAAFLGAAFATAACASEPGTYYGVDAASFSKNVPDPVTGAVNQQFVTGYRLLWGKHISKMLAVEAEAVDFGRKSNASTVGMTFWGIGMSGVGIVPLDDNFSVYLKMGLATTIATDAALTNTVKISPTLGMCLQLEVNPNIAVRLSTNTYLISTSGAGLFGNNNASIDALGIIFRF